jgi:hypothetical protein
MPLRHSAVGSIETGMMQNGQPVTEGEAHSMPKQVVKYLAALAATILVAICAPRILAQRIAPVPLKTRAVVLVVSDGLRWQEVFTGADPLLLDSKHGGIWAKPEDLKRKFLRDDVTQRRALLFPFLWGVVAKQGVLYGNRTKGSDVHVTNGLAFSYPGYNEMLSGAPDPHINSNDFGPNPNVSVFEWLNTLPEFHGRVAAFATWAAFKDIFNQPRSHLDVHAGWAPPYAGPNLTPREELLNDLYLHSTRLEDDDTSNALLQPALLDYVKSQKPRVLFVGYGETDNWAHSGRYDLVLESAHEWDHFVAELWNTMQEMPEYKDQVTFILTTDHGRGSGPSEWKEHGKDQKGSENIWLAVLGPDTPPLGERTHSVPITQSQIAATVAALLGQDFRTASPRAAVPIDEVMAGR